MISAKYTSLLLLILQNASVSMLTRLSRTPSTSTSSSHSILYNPSAAVFVAEIIKFIVSLSMLVRDERRSRAREKEGKNVVLLAKNAVMDLITNQRREVFKLTIPAALYAAQNTLLYTALSNLDAATYQTTYQLKLLTAALFSVIFFQRHLSLLKWFALVLLTSGVAIVQLESVSKVVDSTSSSSLSGGGEDKTLGLISILLACLTSGLAGGYFEYVLKSSTAAAAASLSSSTPTPNKAKKPSVAKSTATPTLWTRNLQLSIPSLLFSFAGVVLSEGGGSAAITGLLTGFTPLVWSVVLNQAVGGLLVAMVIREADGVAKGFATSLAIVVSTVASSLYYRVIPGSMFILGASLVIVSTVLYASDVDKKIVHSTNKSKIK